jgi:hypothetical protein
LAQQALIWESSEPYLYPPATHDGQVICDGEGEEFSKGVASRFPAIAIAMRYWLRRQQHHVLDARGDLAEENDFGKARSGRQAVSSFVDWKFSLRTSLTYREKSRQAALLGLS